MQLIFLGGFFPKEVTHQILNKSKKQIQNAANKFQWAFIKGLQENLTQKIFLITAPSIGWFPVYYKSIYLKSRDFSSSEISSSAMVGFLNLPVIKNFFKEINLKKQLLKTIQSIGDNTIIIIYSLDTPYLSAATQLKKEYPNLKICVIVPDLHEFPGDSSFLYKWYVKYHEKPKFYRLFNKIDCFVLLADKMSEYLKITKPWVRVEGLYEETERNSLIPIVKKDDKRIVLYTGTLDFKYGIKELLSAFSLIEDKTFELWICGGGYGAGFVQKFAAKDTRIKYLGILPSDAIWQLQKKATLLVNPRNTIGEYNKYSFPSKTMEYFASGVPSLLYRLEGIPDEYFNYCYTVEDNEIKSLANAIRNVCSLDKQELALKGLKAREFILDQKTATSQCKKVVAMLQNLN